MYLTVRSLDPTGKGRIRWSARWKPALNAFAITFADRWPSEGNTTMKTPVTHLTRQARHEFEMDAIAACFIGGTAVTGGIGTIPGAMVGALIMGVLNQGLSIMGVDAAWVKTIKGLVVIAAVAYDLLSKKKKG